MSIHRSLKSSDVKRRSVLKRWEKIKELSIHKKVDSVFNLPKVTPIEIKIYREAKKMKLKTKEPKETEEQEDINWEEYKKEKENIK